MKRLNSKRIQHYIDQLEEIRNQPPDPEAAHHKADEVLRDILKELGLDPILEAYDNIQPKWAA